MGSRSSLPALCAALALLAGCGDDENGGDGGGAGTGGGGDAPSQLKVNIASFKFVPPDIRVKAGGTITWTNQDRAPHTAEADENAPAEFDTDRLDLGQSKAVKVSEPGSYTYFCRFHRFMEGKLEVVE